uniref:Uncharacterized protein n=1 Tax=Anguilla anguilla TaxID=7936 RepID=A0A0E9VPD9_ANGAN
MTFRGLVEDMATSHFCHMAAPATGFHTSSLKTF